MYPIFKSPASAVMDPRSKGQVSNGFEGGGLQGHRGGSGHRPGEQREECVDPWSPDWWTKCSCPASDKPGQSVPLTPEQIGFSGPGSTKARSGPQAMWTSCVSSPLRRIFVPSSNRPALHATGRPLPKGGFNTTELASVLKGEPVVALSSPRGSQEELPHYDRFRTRRGSPGTRKAQTDPKTG